MTGGVKGLERVLCALLDALLAHVITYYWKCDARPSSFTF